MDSQLATSSSRSTLHSSNDGDRLEGDLVLETHAFVKPVDDNTSNDTGLDSGLRWQLGQEKSSRSKEGRGEEKPESHPSFPIKLKETGEKGRYILKADDPELGEILRKWLRGEADSKHAKRRTRFRDLVFTRQFSAFDRQNSEKSPFHGFYTLFWLSTFLMLVRITAMNWNVHGNVFGRNEILSLMFHREVLVLGLTDGFMCASTVFCLLLQKTISAGFLSWNRHGWIIQHVGHDIHTCFWQ